MTDADRIAQCYECGCTSPDDGKNHAAIQAQLAAAVEREEKLFDGYASYTKKSEARIARLDAAVRELLSWDNSELNSNVPQRIIKLLEHALGDEVDNG